MEGEKMCHIKVYRITINRELQVYNNIKAPLNQNSNIQAAPEKYFGSGSSAITVFSDKSRDGKNLEKIGFQ